MSGRGSEAADPGPAAWLRDAVVYEIYPQSFADGDGDGVGDLPGALARLDHLAWLGVDTVWFNPCFASPFRDAGYDVSDYLSVAPRYGTNADLVAFVEAAAQRGIRVLLDLVAGHTSDEHAWFVAACHDEADDRYVWSQAPGEGFVPSPGPRGGYYLKNFYDTQPALNFGYARPDPAEPWRDGVEAPGPRANVEALRGAMDFWLRRGVAGFRVDMAFSLVKDDPGFTATMALWRELSAWLREAHPGAVLVPEGVEPAPAPGAAPAFDADYVLVIGAEHSALFNNGGAGTLPWVDPAPCFFDAAGHGSTAPFLDLWEERTAALGAGRPVILPSSDHDFSRLACGGRTAEQLGAAMTFLLTFGTVPSLYAGDEIGVRYLASAPSTEGSACHPTYDRAGARTPMQWDASANAGFSTADPGNLYLPLDPDPQRPTVAAQREDPTSLLHLVRDLIALRRSAADLGGCGATTVLHAGVPLAYRRGEHHLVVVNPTAEITEVALPGVSDAEPVLVRGVAVEDGQALVDAFGHGVFRARFDEAGVSP